MAGDPFTEVPGPPNPGMLDAWGGWDGLLPALYVTSGSRGEAGGGSSRVFRLDAPGEGDWVDDGAPSGAETLNKIRSGLSPDSGLDALYAFFESPGSGQTWLISKTLPEGTWDFVEVPVFGEDPTNHMVGGRGVGINGATGGRLLVGASNYVSNESNLYERVGGSWILLGAYDPSLMWEIEFNDAGQWAAFWNDFGTPGAVSEVLVDGVAMGPSPGGDISCATWFQGAWYTIGALAGGGGLRNAISRSVDGGTWSEVHRFEVAALGDHILAVPRGVGELWAVGHDPLEVAWSLDGETWTRVPDIPPMATGTDTNHLTAIAYWQDAVWLFSRDAATNTCRVFRDKGGGGGDVLFQVI
jgi:hypothetical protein